MNDKCEYCVKNEKRFQDYKKYIRELYELRQAVMKLFLVYQSTDNDVELIDAFENLKKMIVDCAPTDKNKIQ